MRVGLRSTWRRRHARARSGLSCLDEIRTERYRAHIHPRTQLAGIVASNRLDSARTIKPQYYFRLDLPERLRDAALDDTWKAAMRTVALRDPFERYLYLQHLPNPKRSNRASTCFSVTLV